MSNPGHLKLRARNDRKHVTKSKYEQLHKHALSNSKRGIAVDENGKLDDEVSVISSEVS